MKVFLSISLLIVSLTSLVPNATAQWTEFEYPLLFDLDIEIQVVKYITKDTLVKAENYNTIYVSTDGGVNWDLKVKGSSFFGHYCRSFYYDRENHRIWAGCDGGQLYISDDYGNTWTEVWKGNRFVIFNSIYAFDKDKIFFTDETEGFGFYSVSDENETYIQDSLRGYANVVSRVDVALEAEFLNDSVGYLIFDVDFNNSHCPHIFKTRDGGLTWSMVASNRPPVINEHGIFIFQFLTEDLAYGVDKGYSSLYRTVDGGKSWDLVFDAGGRIVTTSGFIVNNQDCFHFVNENFGVVVTRDEIFRTRDGGQSWDRITPEVQYDSRFFDGVECYDTANCIVYGHGNYVTGSPYKAKWITSTGGGKGRPLSTDQDMPGATSAQLWPVPTNNTTQLSLSGYTGETLIRVQDMAGRWVYTTTTGAPQLTLPSDQWPAGMYLVHIIAEDQPTEVLKLVRQ